VVTGRPTISPTIMREAYRITHWLRMAKMRGVGRPITLPTALQ
jgi:hypothetical protein